MTKCPKLCDLPSWEQQVKYMILLSQEHQVFEIEIIPESYLRLCSHVDNCSSAMLLNNRLDFLSSEG